MIEITPERLLAVVDERGRERTSPLLVFWLRVFGDRGDYRDAVLRMRESRAVVPLIVRDGFANPNAIHSDLAELVGANREAFDGLSVPFTGGSPLVIALLGRTDLGLSQVASPATMPEWLPQFGSSAVEILIENLATSAMVPLNAVEARVDEIASALFELEGGLCTRLAAVREADHNRGNALFESVRDRRSPETYRDILEAALEQHKTVQNPAAFRPSAADGRSLIGRLMRAVSANSPDALDTVAKALVAALKLDKGANLLRESLPSVLLRSTNRDADEMVRVGRNILVTVFAAAQFSTGAAHADDYPPFLVVLLQGMSYNLRETLRDAVILIAGLEPLPPRTIPEKFRSAGSS